MTLCLAERLSPSMDRKGVDVEEEEEEEEGKLPLSPRIHCGAGNHKLNTNRMKEREGERGWRGAEEEEQREE